MEIIRGKQTSILNGSALRAQAADYTTVHVDLGTGDGRYVTHLAQAHPKWLVIGLDACRENLVAASRRGPVNRLFCIANALALPTELDGLAQQVSIHFPWGSLLTGLLGEGAFLAGLLRLTRPASRLTVCLNAGALAEAGYSLEAGAAQVRRSLIEQGFRVAAAQPLDAAALRACPTTWAKRLAHGRDPRALRIEGVRAV
jgi:16S rRNA (adenine(1408)-N(1))-methyltransferase